MKLSCNSSRYADFKTVVNTWSSDIAHVFYSMIGLRPLEVGTAIVLYTSGLRYATTSFLDGEVTEVQFLIDFPTAVKAAVDANY